MLKEKQKENTIISIKVITGEEIIAKFINMDTPGLLVIESPLAMVMAENPDNPTQTRVMFTPWMVSLDKKQISIREEHIIITGPAREDAAEQYEQAIATI